MADPTIDERIEELEAAYNRYVSGKYRQDKNDTWTAERTTGYSCGRHVTGSPGYYVTGPNIHIPDAGQIQPELQDTVDLLVAARNQEMPIIAAYRELKDTLTLTLNTCDEAMQTVKDFSEKIDALQAEIERLEKDSNP